MHWAYRIAEELIRKHPNRETFVCASGISPSGSVHIGNFREVVTTFFVVKALQNLGMKTRFIFSWDDFDRFRKVPKNVDRSFEQYIGMPYSEIPCPFGCHNSYAEHFEKEFETSLKEFGIVPEFIYQSTEYKSKRYNTQIHHALTERKRIYDVLMMYKTGEASEEERESFYPVNLYCEVCRKDSTEIGSFNGETLRYICSCGHQDFINVREAVNVKLNWKVDWPMRWMAEDVVFEPGGRDHSSATGSYNVSKEIASIIFNHEAPVYEPYEFIGIKGTGEKMSSSSGNNITPEELLKVYTPEVIQFMFAKYQPNAAFHIGLDEDVIRNYTEFERYREADESYLKEEIHDALNLSGLKAEKRNGPRFGQVASILPLVNYDAAIVRDVLSKTGEEFTKEEVIPVCTRVEYWLRNWYPEKAIQVNQDRDLEYYQSLTDTEKNWIKDFVDVLSDDQLSDEEQLMKEVYDICHADDSKVKRSNQKRLFSIIYQLVLNSSNGPRIPLLVHSIGKQRLVELLNFDRA